jgi:curli biogenesis system outer membrane secretion channel CsgG
MRHRWWVAALCTVVVAGQGPACCAAGISGLFHGKDQDQVNRCVQQRAWMAYFQNEKGGLAPVRDTLNSDHDQDWIGLRFTEYDGPRIRLGVLKVLNKSADSEGQQWAGRNEVPVAGIQEMLTAALYNTRRFDVIEQKRIQEIEAQQTRKDVVEPSPSSIMNLGKVLGAQYLVYGTVNEWNPERGSRSVEHPSGGRLLGALGGSLGGALGGALGAVKATKKEAEVAITFTLADVGSGQILYTTVQRARLGEWNVGLGAVLGGSSTNSQKTPVGYAVNACANKAAFEIARFLRNRKWKGSVVEIAKADVFVNAGSQQGMAPQTLLTVQTVERIIKDRETGTVLGEDLRGIGTLEVIAVQPGFSVARVVDGCKGIKPGDRVELATPPVPPAASPECAALDASLAR